MAQTDNKSDQVDQPRLPNPYELLGITHESTLKELKKAYYGMALYCHPDKGGQKEDMCVVQNAYKYCKEQLDNAKANEHTFEELEDEFTMFCKEQVDKPPPFSQIYEEANDWIKDFNREFMTKWNKPRRNPFTDETEAPPDDPFAHGYGELMEESDVKLDDPNYKVETAQAPVEHPFKMEIQVYKDPTANPCTYGNYHRFDTDKCDDFTHHQPGLDMADYKKAFTPGDDYEIIDDEPPTDKEAKDQLDKLIQERNQFVENLRPELRPSTTFLF